MREGLRSSARLRNGSGGDGVGDKENGDVKSDGFDLGGESLGVQGEPLELKLHIEEKGEDVVILKDECELNAEEKGEDVVVVKEECELNVEEKGSQLSVVDVDIPEDVNNGGCEDSDDVEREVKKEEEGLNGTVLASGRVLRSRLKRLDDGKSSSGGNSGVIRGRGRGRGRGGLERLVVKNECEEDYEFVPNGYRGERVELTGEENRKSNLKRKRGRPPKKELEEQDEFVEQLPRKRGRPPKKELKEQDEFIEQLPPKRGRGRPRKDNCLPTVAHDKKVRVSPRIGKNRLRRGDGANVNAVDIMNSRRFSLIKNHKPGNIFKTEETGTSSRRSSEGDLEKKRFSPVKKNIPGKVLKAEKSGKREAKQLVREQIMERLLAAGWTVDYRPRNGRSYNDAVYVSLDKKTHWSITLAYNKLKSHYEAGDGEGTVYGPGFKFTPIPEEDVKILTKVINKKRESKGGQVQKGGKGGKTVDRFKRKRKKGKLGFRAGMVKLVKRKMKRKRARVEESDSDSSPNRMPDRVRDHKRRKTQNKKRSAPLVRNAEVVTDSEVDGYVPYSGKRTVLAWMIDLGTIVQCGKVHYVQHNTEETLLNGKITGNGIHCGCCDEIITISDFEAHAGSNCSNPLKNIRIEGGTSLLQCLLDSWNKQDESDHKGFHFVDVAGEDPNDDTCGVCGDGGDLICCDGCPSTFHQSCLDINKFPSGDWHCIYCCCKFCGSAAEGSNQGDDCDHFSMSKLLTCDLCEEKYHRSCVESNGGDKPNESRDAFCGNRCQELSEGLKMLLGVKHEIEDGFSLTFIWRSDVRTDASQTEPLIVECNAKLAVALSVMDECFMPYIDHRSGTNLIHSILYNCGSNFKRLNYSGFVTAILERGDEIISAATIRFRSNQIAEMPFIGTRYMYRRKGMCRRLLNAIECALSSLNVELLVIPAISELRETWTSVFGFEPLESTSKKIIKNMSLLVFPHVDLLQKKISKQKLAEENMILTEVSNLQKIHTEDKVANDCEEAGPSGSDLIGYAAISSSNADQLNDKTMFIECNGCLPGGSLKNTPEITSSSVRHDISPNDAASQVVSFENLVIEEKSTADLPDYVNDTCDQAEGTSTHENRNHDCIMQNHDVKPIDLVCHSNNCCNVERQCLKDGSVSDEAVLTTNASVQLELKNIAEELPVNCQENSAVVSVLNGDEAEACPAESPNLQTYINAGDGQSLPVYPGFSENIVDGIDENSKLFAVAGAASLPAETDIPKNEDEIPKNEDCRKESSDLAEPDLQADQTARSNAPSLCVTPNTASGVDENRKPSAVAEAGSPPADKDIVPKNEDGVNDTSDLAGPDLQADQTARSNAPSLCITPNTASGVDENSNPSAIAEADPPLADRDIVPKNEDCMKGSLGLAEDYSQADQTAWSNAPSLCITPNTASGVDENSKPSAVAETDPPTADKDEVTKNEDGVEGSLDLAEPDLQADQTTRSNAPLCSTPNTASGVALHCASAGAGNTTCGSTEVMVLSNQAS